MIRVFLAVFWLLAQPAPAQECDDGFSCTVGDMCVEGECTGTRVECPDDGDACTRERCSFATGACTSQLRICAGPCLTGACDSAAGCIPLPDGTPCNDGNLCTTDDRCLVGVCHGASVEDGTRCTDVLGPCTINDRCRQGSCVGELFTCPDADADRCTPELCDFVTGTCITLPRTLCDRACETGACEADTGLCPVLPDGTSCNDNNQCTSHDGCQAGECVGGAFVPAHTPTVTSTAMVTPSSTATRLADTATPVAPTATLAAPTRTPAVVATPTSYPSPNPPTPPTVTATSSFTPRPSATRPPFWAEGGGCAIDARGPSATNAAVAVFPLAAVALLSWLRRRPPRSTRSLPGALIRR